MGTDYARLHREVVFGKSRGKIIWQPRIGCWYTDRLRRNEPLPAPYTGLSKADVYRRLGCCSARVYDYNECFRPVEHPEVRVSRRKLSATDTETTIHTPVGRQVAVTRQMPLISMPIHLKWEIADAEEMRVATWRAERTAWQWDAAAFERVGREWGGLGAPTMYLPRVNVQDLYVNTMGVENAVYALYDWPGPVEAYFRALDDGHDRLIDVINASPIEIINFGDNVHCGTLPPDLFRKYVLPAYQRRCRKLHRAGKFVCAHWDGNTKALLPFAGETGLDGIEAITPEPQGDVTIEEIKAALGDRLFLLDGIPAIFFDQTYPVAVLENCARRLIELFAPRLVLGISDEISSTGDIERIRVVADIVEDYNARAGG